MWKICQQIVIQPSEKTKTLRRCNCNKEIYKWHTNTYKSRLPVQKILHDTYKKKELHQDKGCVSLRKSKNGF